ncbi:MAG: hypothetical protein R2769_06420 [Saprospiraceae bacterium]
MQRVKINYFKPLPELMEMEERIQGFSDSLVSLSENFESPVIFYNMFLVWAYRYEMAGILKQYWKYAIAPSNTSKTIPNIIKMKDWLLFN